MISLNLSSPYQKKEVYLKRFYYLLKNHFCLIMVIAVISSIVLAIASHTLEKDFNDIVSEATLIQKQIQGSNEKIVAINDKLAELEKIQNQFIPWSNIFVYLLKNIPPNIRLDFIGAQPEFVKKSDPEKWTVIMKGAAKNREDFLFFQNQVKKLPLFEKIETPVSNLTKKTDVDFEFRLTITLKTIREKIR